MPAVGEQYVLHAPGGATWLTARRPSGHQYERVQLTAGAATVVLDEPGRWVFLWSNDQAQTVDVGNVAPPGPVVASPADPVIGGPAYVPFTSGTGY